MRWTQPFPRWAQVMMVCFGLANISGAIGGLEYLLPSLAIGGIWALVGWRGFPLIDSIPADSQDIASGLKTIQRRQRIAFMMPLSAVICVPAVLIAPEKYRMTAFLLGAMPAAVALFVYAWSACPRCRKHFYFNGRRGSRATRCANCGLSLWQ